MWRLVSGVSGGGNVGTVAGDVAEASGDEAAPSGVTGRSFILGGTAAISGAGGGVFQASICWRKSSLTRSATVCSASPRLAQSTKQHTNKNTASHRVEAVDLVEQTRQPSRSLRTPAHSLGHEKGKEHTSGATLREKVLLNIIERDHSAGNHHQFPPSSLPHHHAPASADSLTLLKVFVHLLFFLVHAIC